MTDSPSETVKTFTAIKVTVELALHDLDHLEAFTPSSLIAVFACNLIDIATAFFDEEGEREASLGYTLEGLFVGSAKWEHAAADGAVKPGGVWLEGLFAYLIVDIKDEPGLGGDPSCGVDCVQQDRYSREGTFYLPHVPLLR